MPTVTIRLRGADFAHQMVEMRTWLDQHMFEPARFTHRQDGELVVVSIDFQKDHHAEAFESRFGQLPEGDGLPRSRHDPLMRVVGAGSSREIPATMAQACWWRLLAEEIRTEADNFGSPAAKETMEVAARGWEQLAEELEHRLTRSTGQRQVPVAAAGWHPRETHAAVPSEQGEKSFRPTKSPASSSIKQTRSIG